MKYIVILLTIIFFATTSFAQYKESNNTELILESISDEVPQLGKTVSFSISNIELFEFLRALGVSNKLNLNIDPTLKSQIAINFTDVTIKDLLLYLCNEYGLDLLVTGNIITISKHPEYQPPPEPIVPKVAKIIYNDSTKYLSYDLQNDTLNAVLKKITDLTDFNVLTQSSLKNTLVYGYIKDMPVSKAISELAEMNNLSFVKKDSSTFYIQSQIVKNDNHISDEKNVDGLILKTNKIDSVISISAKNVSINKILSSVSKDLNINYFLLSEITGNITLSIENIDFANFIRLLLNNSEYSYKKVDNLNLYLIGEKKADEIRYAQVYNMKHRIVSNVVEKVPSSLKKNIEILTAEDLNSLIVTGPQPAVNEVFFFLEQIDKVIPVINIELIILDIRKTHAVSTGIIAGVDNSKNKSSYTSVFPSVDVSLGASTINNIIDGVNGTGLVNLGKVTPDFYVGLKASEDNGNLRIRSTPKLATLNGKEATMTIGETRYYIEQTTNVITTQSTTTVTGINYKELQANFGITIKPIVSGDEQITLDIAVEQSTFTEQATKNGPYGRLTRSFKSSVRVKNNDMILLGGLEEKNQSDAGNGFPVLSRIPIIKWLFSSRSNSSKKSKLVILIHPTVFY